MAKATKTKTKELEVSEETQIDDVEDTSTKKITTKKTKSDIEDEMAVFLKKTTGVEIQNIKDVDAVTKYINSGNYSLNFAITGDLRKGFPAGRIYTLEGESGRGKSLESCATALENIKDSDGVSIILDIENALTGDFLTKIANNNAELASRIKIVNNITTIEELQNFMNNLIEFQMSKKMSDRKSVVLVVDSWSILSSRHEVKVVEENSDKKDMSKATAARQLFRALSGRFKAANITPLLVMHLTQNIGVMFGDKTVPASHGNAAIFMSSTRLQLYATQEIIDKNKNPIGTILTFKTKKNRYTYKNKEAKVAFYFSGEKIGIDRFSGLLETLVSWGILSCSNKDPKKWGPTAKFILNKDTPDEQEFTLKGFEKFMESFGGEDVFIDAMNERLRSAISGTEISMDPSNFMDEDDDDDSAVIELMEKN